MSQKRNQPSHFRIILLIIKYFIFQRRSKIILIFSVHIQCITTKFLVNNTIIQLDLLKAKVNQIK